MTQQPRRRSTGGRTITEPQTTADAAAPHRRTVSPETQRLYALDAWRETPFYSAREQAALAWTEALTHLEKNRVPDEIYERARKEFSEKELADLTLAVVAINGWNRLSIAFRNSSVRRATQPGSAMTGSATGHLTHSVP